MPSVCLLLAEGFEEIEAITVLDVLRRADIAIKAVGVDSKTVRGSHHIVIESDMTLTQAEAQPWDLIILPGGMPGSTHLRDDARVQALIKAQFAHGKKLAAICAAPIALAQAGILDGKRVTSFPSFCDQLGRVTYLEDPVVVDGQLTTSRGPATALAFALELVTQLKGPDTTRILRQAMLVD